MDTLRALKTILFIFVFINFAKSMLIQNVYIFLVFSWNSFYDFVVGARVFQSIKCTERVTINYNF